jgi:hypothetical protein
VEASGRGIIKALSQYVAGGAEENHDIIFTGTNTLQCSVPHKMQMGIQSDHCDLHRCRKMYRRVEV